MTTAYNLTLGPMEVGNSLNLYLFGILTVQAYQYFTTFKDPKWLRSIIGFIILLDAVQTAIMCYMVWAFTVTNYDNPTYLAYPLWSIGSIPFFSVPIAWLVQGFYAWRIWQLTDHRKLVPGIILGFSIVQGLGGLGSGIGAFLVKSVEDFPKLQPIAIIWFVGSIVCDTIITVTMVYVLWQSRTGFRETDTLITKIIRTVVETGLSTTTIVILDAIFFFQMGHTNMHLAVVIIAGKTYSNSMLYTLNTRSTLRNKSNVHTTGPGVFASSELVFTNPQVKESAITRSTGTSSLPTTARSRSTGNGMHETVIVMNEIKSVTSESRSRKDHHSTDDLEAFSGDDRDVKVPRESHLEPSEM